jgi:hypothetical protein
VQKVHQAATYSRANTPPNDSPQLAPDVSEHGVLRPSLGVPLKHLPHNSTAVVSRALTVLSWRLASFLQRDVRKRPGKPAF